MAASVTRAASLSWNPFLCRGTALLPNVLLAAKLIALCLLLTFQARLLPAPLAPFLPGPAVLWVLRVVFLASAVLLLCNRSARLMSLLLGLSIVVGVLSSRPHSTHSLLFCGLFLVLLAVQKPVDEPWLLRWLVAVFYVGAGLHKLLNGDGSWGQFFGHGAGETLRDGGSMALAATLTELGLGAGFLVRRLYPWCVWMGVLFHAWVTWFGGGVSTMFLYAMPAAYLVFVDWPRTPLIVLYDGDCGFCNKTREWISRADFEGLYDWRPYQSGAGVAYGIPQKALEERAYVVVGERIYSGFQAFRILALYNPLTYFAIAVLLAVLAAWEPSIRNALLGALILFFSPLFRPLGEAAYKLVARNRHRLPPKTCKAPEL